MRQVECACDAASHGDPDFKAVAGIVMLYYYAYERSRRSSPMADHDPFLSSLVARPAYHRVVAAAGLVAALWLAVLWAASLA